MNTALPQLNDDDIELLSAYIDNELSAADRARLEVRLQAEPLLRTTLAELQATVTALQSLEPLRPPRSFTLDPADARVRSAAGGVLVWLRSLQLAGGVAAIVLVMALTLTLSGGDMAGAPLPAAAPQFAEAPAAAPAPTMAAAAPATANEPGMAAAEAVPLPTTTPAPMNLAAAPDAAPLPTATAEMMMSVAAEPTDVAAAEAAPEMARVQEDTAAGAPAVKAPSADTDGVMPQVASPDPLEQQAPSVTATGWSVRMVAPIIALLAALVVIAAIIATIRQRARNR